MEPRSPGRTGRPYRRLRERVKRSTSLCCLCGGLIDYTLEYPHPMSFSLEHHQPLTKGGAPLDPANAGAAHLQCNVKRGNRDAASVRPLPQSRKW